MRNHPEDDTCEVCGASCEGRWRCEECRRHTGEGVSEAEREIEREMVETERRGR